MWRISKEFSFSAAHRLQRLPADHPCNRVHGHNYVVILELESNHLDGFGFVLDYGDLAPVRDWIDAELDHGGAHRELGLNYFTDQPTAEWLAEYIWRNARVILAARVGDRWEHIELRSVTVKETPKTTATYHPRRP